MYVYIFFNLPFLVNIPVEVLIGFPHIRHQIQLQLYLTMPFLPDFLHTGVESCALKQLPVLFTIFVPEVSFPGGPIEQFLKELKISVLKFSILTLHLAHIP